MSKKPVAIVGANGYSGEELCALLARHPNARIAAVSSRQHANKSFVSVLPRFEGWPTLSELQFCPSTLEPLLASGAEFFFLALPHGLASEFAVPLIEAGKRVIDLSADFRLRDPGLFEEFYGSPHPSPEFLSSAVYGLPELHRESIRDASLVASAGCYPTSILLPLVPLLNDGLIVPTGISVSSASGVTGAGRKSDLSLLFAECNESFRAYGVPKHRHLSEIEQELSIAHASPVTITFVPHLAPVNRGIHTTTFAFPADGCDEAAIFDCLNRAYSREPFVRVRADLPDTKFVVGTNFCDISARFDPRTNRVILFSAEDNLVKGASGQAIQNFNIMAGFDETTGLL